MQKEKWSYQDYLDGVQRSIDYATKELGFNLEQALGYAQTDLELRVEWFPAESILFLTALVICSIRHGVADAFKTDEFFLDAIRAAYAQQQNATEVDDRLAEDMEHVKTLFGI